MKHIASVMFMLLAGLLIYASVSWANCTGCGEDGHQMCPIEDKEHKPDRDVALIECQRKEN